MEKTSVFLEEHLREAAAMGDIKAVHEFINLGVDVNARNAMNGWYLFFSNNHFYLNFFMSFN